MSLFSTPSPPSEAGGTGPAGGKPDFPSPTKLERNGLTGAELGAQSEHRPSTSGGGLSRGSRDDHIMITPAEKISGDEVNIPICRSCVVCFVDESCSDRGFIVLGASLSAIISKKTHLASLSLPVSTSVRSRFLRVMIISIYLSTLSICGCTCPGSGYHGAVSAE
jgi:hypothetical protein